MYCRKPIQPNLCNSMDAHIKFIWTPTSLLLRKVRVLCKYINIFSKVMMQTLHKPTPLKCTFWHIRNRFHLNRHFRNRRFITKFGPSKIFERLSREVIAGSVKLNFLSRGFLSTKPASSSVDLSEAFSASSDGDR